jgi:hypothetical protein
MRGHCGTGRACRSGGGRGARGRAEQLVRDRVRGAANARAGVGVIRVEHGGRSGTLQAIARISSPSGATERADPHGIAVRRR